MHGVRHNMPAPDDRDFFAAGKVEACLHAVRSVSWMQSLGLSIPCAMQPATVVDIATSNADFSTLVAAVAKADLVGALSEEGPFTVFAPTNAAFEALLAKMGATPEELLANPFLAAILKYHVVPGKVGAQFVSLPCIILFPTRQDRCEAF